MIPFNDAAQRVQDLEERELVLWKNANKHSHPWHQRHRQYVSQLTIPTRHSFLVYFYQLGVIYILRVTFGASKKVGFYFRMHVSISKTIFSHLSANSFEKKVGIMHFIYLWITLWTNINLSFHLGCHIQTMQNKECLFILLNKVT